MQKILGLCLVVSIFSGSVTGGLVSYGLNRSEGFGQSSVTDSANSGDSGSLKNRVIEEESALINAVENASPAVLSIIASKDLQSMYSNPFFFRGIPFQLNVPNIPESESESGEDELTKIGGGTGFLVTEDGLVLTNRHVVSDEEAEYTAVTNDGTTYFATVVSKDPTNDLAVVQIFTDEERKNKPKELPTLELGDSDSLKIGSKVIAIGNALSEFENTTTSGIISGKGRKIVAGGGGQRSTSLFNLLQTDAAINPGNSGGPLVNLSGQVIGINTAIAQEANGIGFAIPINDVKSVIESVQQFGKIVRPYLGVRYSEITATMAQELDLPVEAGAYILDDVDSRTPAVVKDSPADKAGLRSGDIITKVNNEAIDENNSLVRLVSKYKVGETIKLEVVRGNRKITVNVKLEEFGS